MTNYTILPMNVVLETDLVGGRLGEPWVSSKYCKAGDVCGKLNSVVFENIALIFICHVFVKMLAINRCLLRYITQSLSLRLSESVPVPDDTSSS